MTPLPTELLWLRTLTGNQCELKAVALESRHRVEAMLEAELLVQIVTEQGPVVCLGPRGRRLLRQPDSALPRQHRALTNLLQRRIGEYLRHSGYSFGHRSRNALVLESEGVQAILLIAQYEAPSFAALRRYSCMKGLFDPCPRFARIAPCDKYRRFAEIFFELARQRTADDGDGFLIKRELPGLAAHPVSSE